MLGSGPARTGTTQKGYLSDLEHPLLGTATTCGCKPHLQQGNLQLGSCGGGRAQEALLQDQLSQHILHLSSAYLTELHPAASAHQLCSCSCSKIRDWHGYALCTPLFQSAIYAEGAWHTAGTLAALVEGASVTASPTLLCLQLAGSNHSRNASPSLTMAMK